MFYIVSEAKNQCLDETDLIIPEWLFQLTEIANAERIQVLSISVKLYQ